MATPYISEIKIVSFNFPPKGWAACDGQTLPINQNQALFSLLGTMYGGNGQTTFALPNLQGAVPLHFGQGFTQGEKAGEVNHTLQTGEMPTHIHIANGTTSISNTGNPATSFWGNGGLPSYSTSPPTPTSGNLPANALANAGGGQPHNNQQPYLVLYMVIALQGIFPSRN